MKQQAIKSNSTYSLIQKRSRRVRQGGFTLLETMIGTVLAAMLLLTAFDIYFASLSLATKSNAQVSSASSALVALRHVCADSREAFTFALPTDPSGFIPPSSYTVSNFESTVNGSTVCTGVQIIYGANLNVSVFGTSGLSLLLRNQPYNQTATNSLWIYRSNGDGKPNPTSGNFLWMVGSEGGVSVNRSVEHLFDTDSASAATPAAVVISRPVDNSSIPQVIPNQIRFQIISGYYSPGATQTSVNGSLQYNSECVLIRNHG